MTDGRGELDSSRSETEAEEWRDIIDIAAHTARPDVQRLLLEDAHRDFISEQTGIPKAALKAMALIRQDGPRRARGIAETVLGVTRSKDDADVLNWIDEYRSMLPRWRRITGF